MKIVSERMERQLGIAVEKIRKIEDIAIEIIQKEPHKEKRNYKHVNNISDQWTTLSGLVYV